MRQSVSKEDQWPQVLCTAVFLGIKCPSPVWWGRRCFPVALPCFVCFPGQVRSNPGAHGWFWLPGRLRYLKRRFWGLHSLSPSLHWCLPTVCLWYSFLLCLCFLCKLGLVFNKHSKLVKLCRLHFVVICCEPSDHMTRQLKLFFTFMHLQHYQARLRPALK